MSMSLELRNANALKLLNSINNIDSALFGLSIDLFKIRLFCTFRQSLGWASIENYVISMRCDLPSEMPPCNSSLSILKYLHSSHWTWIIDMVLDSGRARKS
jgi:hypothetical protein